MTTAESVTDEQIRALLVHLRSIDAYECTRCGHAQTTSAQCESCLWGDLYHARMKDMRACYAALSTSEIVVSSWTKEAARLHVAALLNATKDSP